MGLLKKLKAKKQSPLTVGGLLNKFVLIEKLKKNRLLATTDQGIFYTYAEVLKVNKDSTNLLKQLYVYGRSTGLLQEGEVLHIKERTETEDILLATVQGDKVKLFYTEKAEN